MFFFFFSESVSHFQHIQMIHRIIMGFSYLLMLRFKQQGGVTAVLAFDSVSGSKCSIVWLRLVELKQ